MKRIMIFAGTTEGRELSELLCEHGISHIISVATEYGKQVCENHPCARLIQGRMNAEEIRDFLQKEQMDLVIDATHPYAVEVTENIKHAVQGLPIRYMRYVREMDPMTGDMIHGTSKADIEKGSMAYNSEEEKQKEYSSDLTYYNTSEDCAQALQNTTGTILLTTGSKELAVFCGNEDLKRRLVVRVLPGMESLALCEAQGLLGKQIIAMQGPFSEELNLALIRQYKISVLVTKQSGKNGGFEEKLAAAGRAGIQVCVIGVPKPEQGNTLEEILQAVGVVAYQKSTEERPQKESWEIGVKNPTEGTLSKDESELQESNQTSSGMRITLIGCGMGTDHMLTVAAKKCIEQADILLGAKRLIEPYTARIDKQPYYLAKDILPYLKQAAGNDSQKVNTVGILFSGDTGFYSGCGKLYLELNEAVKNGELQAELSILPGISSISYLAARLCTSWEDAAIMSVHGKGDIGCWGHELLKTLSEHEKTFLLVSKAQDVAAIYRLLKHDKNRCVLYAGYQMSYEDEKLICIYPSNSEPEDLQEGLYTCMIQNPDAAACKDRGRNQMYYRSIPDSEFLRGSVPMTKEEIRQLSIAKLDLTPDSVVYDIGSGTGSVAVAMAGISPDIQVYAVERKQEAVALIRSNQEKFQRKNLYIIEAEAPDGLEELPVPTHAFIGGSGGYLKEILRCLYQKNPAIRIVINAVSIETLEECMQVEKEFPVMDFSMVQVNVTRIRELGAYHMMQGENPVWICSFRFTR